MDFGYSILILIIPFISFLLLGIPGQSWPPKVAGITGTVALGVVTVLSYYTAYMYFFPLAESYETIIPINLTWLPLTDSLIIKMGIYLDPISVMMLVVISTVSFMVHVYSLGYMKGENGFQRYFAFLSLFSFSMLGLVLATNIFQMYIFWELVGVSSYLLIGFYYEKPSAIAASKKAFIVTRFADLGFLIGILILSFYTNTFDFALLTDVNGPAIANPPMQLFLGGSIITWAMALIFIGGAGKSAMFPLHIWLPDAMEGPTPVSALIHAATMVVAGVFLVARLFPVYFFSAPDALIWVGYIGSFTSLFAAVIACTQFDIKRILAFSTLSQIGYMMVALGVSGYGGEAGVGYMASMFHLFTHAFFKALLFLGAGSVIHAVHSNMMQDMGGLRKYMPITHITFLIACLAIAGIPPFSGFFSKDEILVAASEHNKLIYYVQAFVAGLTAFYMFRLYFSTFWKSNPEYHHKPHESSLVMTIPLMILAVLSIVGGFVPFHHLVTSDAMPFDTHMHWNVALPSIGLALIGIGIASTLYFKENTRPDSIAASFKGFYTLVYNKFYIDEIYLFITKKIIFNLISRPVAWFDRHIVDGAMNLTGNSLVRGSVLIKGLQSGHLHVYIFYFSIGVLALALAVLYYNFNIL